MGWVFKAVTGMVEQLQSRAEPWAWKAVGEAGAALCRPEPSPFGAWTPLSPGISGTQGNLCLQVEGSNILPSSALQSLLGLLFPGTCCVSRSQLLPVIEVVFWGELC